MDPHALALSLVVAVEPLPVLAGVLLLTAERGRPKAVAFLAGWLLALAACALATIVVASNVTTPPGSTSSKVSAVLDLLLGLVLAVLAFRQRPGREQDAGRGRTTPTWMSRLDSMSPFVAFGLGLFLPPYVIAVAIGNDIVRQGAPPGRMVVSVLGYTTIASLGVLVPILLTVVVPERSGAVLTRWRAWLEVHWPAVLFWLLVVLAVYLATKGVLELVA